MYLKRIAIKNIKCFEDLELDFGEPGSIRLWTAILGENGLGKSTLLQAIATVLAGPLAIRELLPIADGWVRESNGYGTIDADLLQTAGDSSAHPRPFEGENYYPIAFLVTSDSPNNFPNRITGVPYSPLSVDMWFGDGSLQQKLKMGEAGTYLLDTVFSPDATGWCACGYGPFRRLTGGTQEAETILRRERRSARFVTLFREGAALTNAEEWLKELHNTAREGNEPNRRALERITEALRTGFFPVTAELRVSASEVTLQLEGERPQHFDQLSDGYRVMLATGIDILRWLIRSFPNSPHPAQEAGVVLIDELDAHLHPTWQRKIGLWLRTKFPRLQFIVATHSPFLAQVAEGAGNIVLEKRDGQVQVRQEVESVHTWRADQILTELFQLPNTYSPDVAEKLRRFQELYQRHSEASLSPAEEMEFQELCRWQETLPAPLEDPEQRRLSERLKQAIDGLDDELQALS